MSTQHECLLSRDRLFHRVAYCRLSDLGTLKEQSPVSALPVQALTGSPGQSSTKMHCRSVFHKFTKAE